jgi:hypothetical protein
MGAANKKHQAILAIGINKPSFAEFAGKESDESEIYDIFGEFANSYYALLIDNHEFRNSYGILNQSLPMLYLKGQHFLPFISGVQGEIFIGDKWLSIGFAIKNCVKE